MRSRSNRGDRGVEIAKRRDEDDGHIGTLGNEPRAELKATHSAHAHIGHDGVEVVLIDCSERLLSA